MIGAGGALKVCVRVVAASGGDLDFEVRFAAGGVVVGKGQLRLHVQSLPETQTPSSSSVALPSPIIAEPQGQPAVGSSGAAAADDQAEAYSTSEPAAVAAEAEAPAQPES